jgi:poly-gamma-glutamate synthesis protein (capsule biosynthesis protein)
MNKSTDSISILFAGDFAPCGGYESLAIKKRGEIFHTLIQYSTSADISFVNLETPLSIKGKPIKKSGPHLRAHPDCIHALAEAGFNVVGLANNHSMDYGVEALEETLEVCNKAGLQSCGAGLNLKEAVKPLFIEKQGLCIAVIAVAEHEFSIADINTAGAAPLDSIDTVCQIEHARGKADFLFVSVHGGNEYFPYPRPGLRKICRYFVDKGADGVICHHPHVPGAYEFYKDTLIVYSLGNLIFDNKKPPLGWNEGYAVYFELDKKEKRIINCDFLPYTQSLDQEGVHVLKDEHRDKFLTRIKGYADTVRSDHEYKKIWHVFCEKKSSDTIVQFFSPIHFRGMNRINRYLHFSKLLAAKPGLTSKLNMIRCESHRELLQYILEEQ